METMVAYTGGNRIIANKRELEMYRGEAGAIHALFMCQNVTLSVSQCMTH